VVVEEHAVKPDPSTMLTMFILFFVLSFFSIGGAISVIPEIHRQAVDVSHWLTDREFVDLIAIAQAAPGPNVLFVTLIGYHVAGVVGALVATFAMCGPACAVAFWVAQVFHRFREKKWRIAVQAGLVPLSIGLIASVALIIARSADHDWKTMLITAAMFGLTYWTRISPIYGLGIATALGVAGFL
jgi:chromate transporter